MNKFIKIKIRELDLFNSDTLKAIPIEESIYAVYGKRKSGKFDTQAYLFDKSKWDMKSIENWLKIYRRRTVANNNETFAKHKLFLTANLVLCSQKPDLLTGSEIKKLAKADIAKAELKDKYYFYVEPVHAGANKNGDYFFNEEIAKSYKTYAHQLIDWEHIRSQIIGFTLEPELINNDDNDDLAIGVSGILHRLSPYMQYEEKDGVTRDDIIKQRYFEGKLAVSMEVYFDKLRCTACGYETDDFLDFEHHRYSSHSENDEVYRGLVGLDFVGLGIVENPADVNADVVGLRTSDNGTLEDIVVDANYDAVFKNDALYASGNKKGVQKIDKKGDNSVSKDTQGGNIMFKLKEKTKDAKNLSDVFVIAQTILKDYKKDNQSFGNNDIEAFISELNDVLSEKLKDASIDEIYTLSEAKKLELISEVRDEEQKKLEQVENELKAKIEKLEKEKEDLQKSLDEAKASIEEFKNEVKAKENEKKINSLVESIEKDMGVELTGSMKDSVCALASKVIEKDENVDDEFKKIHDDFVLMAKQAKLVKASNVLGNAAIGGEKNTDDLEAMLEGVRANFLKEE